MAKNLHIAMYPWFAFGHMIPYIHVANELAERGHRISFFLTNKAQSRLQTRNLHPHLITFRTLTIPRHVDGDLPEGAEIANDIPMELNHVLLDSTILTLPQVQQILTLDKPDFIFHDFAFWIPQLTKKLGIKSVCYLGLSAVAMAAAISPPDDDSLSYPSSTAVLHPEEMAAFVAASDFTSMLKLHERLSTSMRECDVLAIRTCVELEAKFCDYIKAYYNNKPVLWAGPVLAEEQQAGKLQMEEKWADWLRRFDPGSVVYCAFGSQYVIQKEQFEELVLGFELLGLPFLVVLRPPEGCSTVEEALPEGFEERVKGRGVVYGGWVQQPLILSHPSVGCFVTHCGFGSMWEALMSDKQIVLVPQFGDQILNTRLLSTELKVGLEVKREANRWFSKESLIQAIKSVMDKDSEVGILLKKSHEDLRKQLLKPGFASGYTDKFVQDLRQLVSARLGNMSC